MVEKVIIGGKSLAFDWETEYGEPQAWIYLKNGTSIEVTHEENGLKPEEQYFSARIHCSDEDFENDVYHSTMGIIDQCSGSAESVTKLIEREISRHGLMPENTN